MARDKLLQARFGTQAGFDAVNNDWLRGEIGYVHDRGIMKVAREDGLKTAIRFDDLATVRRARVASCMYPSGGLISVRFFPISGTFNGNGQKNISENLSHQLTGGGKSGIYTTATVANNTDLAISYTGLYMGHEHKFMMWSASNYVTNIPNPVSSFVKAPADSIILTGIGYIGPGVHTLSLEGATSWGDTSPGLCLDFTAASDLQVLNLGAAKLGFLDVTGCPLTGLAFGSMDWDYFYTGAQPNLTSIAQSGGTLGSGICDLSPLTALTDVVVNRCDKLILDGLALDTCDLNDDTSATFDIQAVGTVINAGGTMTLTNGDWTIGQLESLFDDLGDGTGTINVVGVTGISDGTWEAVKAIATAKGYTVTDA